MTAVVELKARFDEEANIRWARDLESAGVQVVYGFLELKTHASSALIVRREGGELVTYVHVGTGNYHPVTAQIYTDLSFFTADRTIGRDRRAVFNYVRGYAEPSELERAVSPHGMQGADPRSHPARRRITPRRQAGGDLDEDELARRCRGSSTRSTRRARLAFGSTWWCAVSAACGRAFPDCPRTSGSRSIVGRFLEHARIYLLRQRPRLPSRDGAGLPLLGRLMPRNLDRRVETLVPIENPTVIGRSSTRSWWRTSRTTSRAGMSPDGSFDPTG